jgi:uncharacterized phage-like protein YoqJ
LSCVGMLVKKNVREFEKIIHLRYMEKTLCFTGHRPDKCGGWNPNNPIAKNIKTKLEEAITQAIQEGYTSFISGGALGVDQWAAEIVLKLKEQNSNIKLIIARPFSSQASVWNQESKIIFKSICDRADEVVDVSEEPYAAWKLQKRNEYMVNRSSLVIAVWDGTAGGTANCVNYAKNKLKSIKQINPKE